MRRTATICPGRRHAENVRQARQQAGPGPKEATSLKKQLDEMAVMEAKLRERFKGGRQALMERVKQLEAEEQNALAKLKAERDELLRQQPPRAATNWTGFWNGWKG